MATIHALSPPFVRLLTVVPMLLHDLKLELQTLKSHLGATRSTLVVGVCILKRHIRTGGVDNFRFVVIICVFDKFDFFA
jgi:hypothetical protein